jgi:alpha/beta superfamily hydrolase
MSIVRIPVPAARLTLEALRIGDGIPGAVVAPPHPLYGGHSANPVVRALARGLGERGVTSLAFNWRGIGASEGRASGELEIACEDYRAVLEHVSVAVGDTSRGTSSKGPTPAPLIAAGYSFGAATALALALADPRITEAVLVAPPVALLPGRLSVGRESLRIHVIAAENDRFGPPAELESALSHIAAARFTVIPDADHFFSSGGTDAIARAAARASEAAYA